MQPGSDPQYLNAAYDYILTTAREHKLRIRGVWLSGVQVFHGSGQPDSNVSPEDEIEFTKKYANHELSAEELEAAEIIRTVNRTYGDYVSPGQIRLELIEGSIRAKCQVAAHIADAVLLQVLTGDEQIGRIYSKLTATLIEEMLG